MQIIVDELHLLLRISNVLIRNIVTAATADASIHKDETKQTEKLLESISITFRVCTIHINYIMINSQIWRSKDSKKRYNGHLSEEWTEKNYF